MPEAVSLWSLGHLIPAPSWWGPWWEESSLLQEDCFLSGKLALGWKLDIEQFSKFSLTQFS